MSLKNTKQPKRKETDILQAVLQEAIKEIHKQMEWTRADSDPNEQEVWLRLTIFYCEARIRYLRGQK